MSKCRYKGIWYNPLTKRNETPIKPFAEISSIDKLLSYFTPQSIIDNE